MQCNDATIDEPQMRAVYSQVLKHRKPECASPHHRDGFLLYAEQICLLSEADRS
jgi:hypothetical protein